MIAIFLWGADRAFSQSFEWVKQIGTSGLNRGYSLKTDKLGNIYVTGSFQGTVQFGGVNVTSKGGSDIFIAKYSNSGNLIWIKTPGGTGYDDGYSMQKGRISLSQDSCRTVNLKISFYAGPLFSW